MGNTHAVSSDNGSSRSEGETHPSNNHSSFLNESLNETSDSTPNVHINSHSVCNDDHTCKVTGSLIASQAAPIGNIQSDTNTTGIHGGSCGKTVMETSKGGYQPEYFSGENLVSHRNEPDYHSNEVSKRTIDRASVSPQQRDFTSYSDKPYNGNEESPRMIFYGDQKNMTKRCRFVDENQGKSPNNSCSKIGVSQPRESLSAANECVPMKCTKDMDSVEQFQQNGLSSGSQMKLSEQCNYGINVNSIHESEEIVPTDGTSSSVAKHEGSSSLGNNRNEPFKFMPLSESVHSAESQVSNCLSPACNRDSIPASGTEESVDSIHRFSDVSNVHTVSNIAESTFTGNLTSSQPSGSQESFVQNIGIRSLGGVFTCPASRQLDVQTVTSRQFGEASPVRADQSGAGGDYSSRESVPQVYTHWCHVCNNRVAVEFNSSMEPICFQCKQTGFVELLERQQERPMPQRPLLTFDASGAFSIERFIQQALRGFDTTFSARGADTFGIHPVQAAFFGDDGMMEEIIQLIIENDPNRYGSPPASKEFVKNLKPLHLTYEEAKAQGPCAICQDGYMEEDIVYKLTDDTAFCNHMFHANCIVPWLEQHNSCPVCRFEVVTDDPDYERRKAELRTRVNGCVAARTNSTGSSQAE